MAASNKDSPTSCDITRDLTRAISNINLMMSPTGNSSHHDLLSCAQRNYRSTSSMLNDILYSSGPRATQQSDEACVYHVDQRKPSSQETPSSTKKREVYKYRTDWPISLLAWSNKPGERLTLAVCSFIERYKNHVQIVSLAKDDHDQEIQCISTFNHPYPPTKVLWMPHTSNYCNQSQTIPSEKNSSLLATTADYLRIWRVQDTPKDSATISSNGFINNRGGCANSTTALKPECLLNYHKGSKFCAPLTSFDWNDIDPRLVVTSSVDTTCAIWDIEYEKVVVNYAGHMSPSIQVDVDPKHVSGNLKTQLIAHDHQVYDVAFSRLGSGRDVIVSCSGDRSVRMFDLRRLSTSSVLFESLHASGTALVRVSCSNMNPNLVSTFAIDSKEIVILDVRKLASPLCILKSHRNHVNGMSWAPHSAAHICSGSDDQQALIWDLSNLQCPKREPLLAYRATGKINSISWSSAHEDWIAIGHGKFLELLRV